MEKHKDVEQRVSMEELGAWIQKHPLRSRVENGLAGSSMFFSDGSGPDAKRRAPGQFENPDQAGGYYAQWIMSMGAIESMKPENLADLAKRLFARAD